MYLRIILKLFSFSNALRYRFPIGWWCSFQVANYWSKSVFNSMSLLYSYLAQAILTITIFCLICCAALVKSRNTEILLFTQFSHTCYSVRNPCVFNWTWSWYICTVLWLFLLDDWLQLYTRVDCTFCHPVEEQTRFLPVIIHHYTP